MGKKKYVEAFTHTLIKPIPYALNGETVEAKTITIIAPTRKVLSETTLIEQQFNKALLDVQAKFASTGTSEEKQKEVIERKKEKEAQQSEEEIAEDQLDTVLTMLFSSADVYKCFLALEAILTHQHAGRSMAVLDNNTPFTKGLVDWLGYDDEKELLGKFISNFINSSLSS